MQGLILKDLRSTFESDGYVAIRSFLDKNEVNELLQETLRFIEEEVPKLPGDVIYCEIKDDYSTLKQIQKLNEFDNYFESLARSQKVVGLAEELLGGGVELQNMQYFNKVPRLGKPTPPHQDGYYFMIKPQQAVTMWLSLGEADESNGAVCYIPGSHNNEIRPHANTGTLGFSQGISDWSAEDDAACVQMTAGFGDILVHHSRTIHCANGNNSDHDRKSIGFIFYRDDVAIDQEAHDQYQRNLHESLRIQNKI
jgi:phytanoyl-CoA hydroxylase